jgi:hypothetical protein
MERHLQTAILSILVALLVWVGNAVVQSRDATTRLAEQVTQMRIDMTEMNQRFDKYLLRSEADAKFSSQEIKHAEIDRRLDSIEREKAK